VIDNVVKIKGKNGLHGAIDTTQTHTDAAINRADRLDNSLTRVIAGTHRNISRLHQMKLDAAKMILDKNDDVIADWLGGVTDDEA
jgi:hypothetical protein